MASMMIGPTGSGFHRKSPRKQASRTSRKQALRKNLQSVMERKTTNQGNKHYRSHSDSQGVAGPGVWRMRALDAGVRAYRETVAASADARERSNAASSIRAPTIETAATGAPAIISTR